MTYKIQELKKNNLIIFEAKMGSHAYGTALPTSDVDIRGVFIQPLNDILRYGFIDQVSDEKNDIVYYELSRFVELAIKNNPNVIELLFAPEDIILKNTKYWKILTTHSNNFLTKKCRFTFAGYAIEQIRKAKGYNKKINWEESEMKRKTVLDFCYVLVNGSSYLVEEHFKTLKKLHNLDLSYKDIGLSKINHTNSMYAMYNLSKDNISKGIINDPEKSNDINLTSIPKGRRVIGHMSFNKDAYSTHCKLYKEYQTWLKERNPDRFKMNKEHGKNYDSKNMMHVFRLLNVALEIANERKLNVRRPKDEIKILMKIRKGEYEYDNLLKEAEIMISKLDKDFEKSSLPEKVDRNFINNVKLEIYNNFYE